jgi:hypothetical protein
VAHGQREHYNPARQRRQVQVSRQVFKVAIGKESPVLGPSHDQPIHSSYPRLRFINFSASLKLSLSDL